MSPVPPSRSWMTGTWKLRPVLSKRTSTNSKYWSMDQRFHGPVGVADEEVEGRWGQDDVGEEQPRVEEDRGAQNDGPQELALGAGEAGEDEGDDLVKDDGGAQ